MDMISQQTQDANNASKQRPFQFSLWHLMVTVTIICVCLASYPGRVLLVTLACWLLMAAVIVGGLMLLQAPMYWLILGGGRRHEASECKSEESVDSDP